MSIVQSLPNDFRQEIERELLLRVHAASAVAPSTAKAATTGSATTSRDDGTTSIA